MKVSELGEFGLIELLAKLINKAKSPQDASWQNLFIGIGDDTAAWQGNHAIQLATTDTLVQDVHFNLKVTTWKELGWKALAINLSDIAAMGGIPQYALVSLAVPGELEVDSISDLYQGMIELAQESGVAIAGGDATSAPNIVITITVLGSLKEGERFPLTRSSAIPGDQIAVTGYLGTSAAGLKMLSQGLNINEETSALLRQAHLHPIPRVKEGQQLLQSGVKTAIDVSDGLLSDLSHICELSQVGAQIRLDWLPIHPSVRTTFETQCIELALSGGEDYELLFTANREVMDRVKQDLSCPVTVVGEVTKDHPGQVTVLDESGKIVPWSQKGWEHFKSSPLRY